MEYEIVERSIERDEGGDSRIIRDNGTSSNRSSDDRNEHAGENDRALHIPEEEQA